jgi:hypothetical protein
MSSKYTVDPSGNNEGGAMDWGGGTPLEMPARLFGLAISAHETLTHYMLKQRLTEERYMHVDDTLTDQSTHSVALDKTDPAARQILLGRAINRAKFMLNDPRLKTLMAYTASDPVFYYGAFAPNPEVTNA